MNPSKEVGEASGEETGIGETMEDVVIMVDAMTSAVEAVEAMVMAVEMREWLEVGRPETERTTAIHFFSRALAVQKQKDGLFPRYVLPLYWPGLLPGLAQLLADCLLPHNSKSIQSGAMLSLKYPIYLRVDMDHRLQLLQEITSHVIDPLLRLVRETDCTEIRDQAIWLLGRMAWTWDRGNDTNIDFTWVLVFLPLLTDLLRKYAAISEPTETEMSSLNTATKALTLVHYRLSRSFLLPSWEPYIPEILPVLTGIFQEPGNRKKAQIRVGDCLGHITWPLNGDWADFLLENGMIEMLLETLRVGKEPTDILAYALRAISNFLYSNDGVTEVHVKEVLDMGALGVFHLVLKRPNDNFQTRTLWVEALVCIKDTMRNWNVEGKAEAILSEEGLVELVLEQAFGMDLAEEKKGHHFWTMCLLRRLTSNCSESQMRRLMLKGSFFRLLSRYLNSEDCCWRYDVPPAVQACLVKCSVANRGTICRLLDDTGITDAIRRISLDPDVWLPSEAIAQDSARDILDTYLNHPLPLRTSHNLPSIIFTRNVPS